MQLSRRALMAAIPALGVTGIGAASLTAAAHAQPHKVPKTGTRIVDHPDAEKSLGAWIDEWGRPTAKVTINGQGPFRFLVDTGSTTTVIAQRIAAQLSTPVVGTAVVPTPSARGRIPLVVMIRRLINSLAQLRPRTLAKKRAGEVADWIYASTERIHCLIFRLAPA